MTIKHTVHTLALHIYHVYVHFRNREKIFKGNKFYEETVPKMVPKVLRCYFRMYCDTLNKLTNFIKHHGCNQPQIINTIPLNKQVAMAIAYLGSLWPTMQ